VRGDTIYAGCQDGYVKVLDLETKTSVRTIIVEEVWPFSDSIVLSQDFFFLQFVDIISMSVLGSDLYTCSANGWIKVCIIFAPVRSLELNDS